MHIKYTVQRHRLIYTGNNKFSLIAQFFIPKGFFKICFLPYIIQYLYTSITVKTLSSFNINIFIQCLNPIAHLK